MWIRKLFFSVLLLSCGWLQAQTVWPAVQSNMYPHIPFMKLVRHEQTVLLGEGIRPSSKMAWSYLSTRAHWALSCCSPMSTMLRRTEMGKWVICRSIAIPN